MHYKTRSVLFFMAKGKKRKWRMRSLWRVEVVPMYLFQPFVHTFHVKLMVTWEFSNLVSFLVFSQAYVAPIQKIHRKNHMLTSTDFQPEIRTIQNCTSAYQTTCTTLITSLLHQFSCISNQMEQMVKGKDKLTVLHHSQ